MKCTVSFVSIVVFILIVGTLAILIALTIPASCPSTSFKCDEDDQCFDLRYRCDHKQHCSKGSDELPFRCADLTNLNETLHQTHNMSSIVLMNHTTHSPKSCFIRLPTSCSCSSGFNVNCKNLSWDEIDWSLFDNQTKRLKLEKVLTGDWKEKNHVDFRRLTVLLIEQHPKMRTFPLNFLKDKSNVNQLFFENNAFQSIESKSFEKMKKMEHLYLSNNSIKYLDQHAFSGLDSLIRLELAHNKIQFDGFYQFRGMPNLQFIDLQSNCIETVGSGLFRILSKLTHLNLDDNRIRDINGTAFSYNLKLSELSIARNRIHSLDPNIFHELVNLVKLSISGNPIHRLSPDLFSSSHSLESLYLEGLDLENIDLQIFSLLGKLNFVHFEKFEYCQYIPRVPNCRPSTDGISSIQNLLNGTFIRVTVWIIATITVIGNVLVFSTRWKKNKESQILDIFIKNLAAADLLMGVYLGIIAIKDLQYRGFFNTYAYSWSNSWECIMIGATAMISSEVSISVLTVMSLERYLVISGPFSYKKLNRKWAMGSMGLLWGFIIALALTPAFMWKSSYFGSSGLCFTLHLHDPFAMGWEYNAFVFIGLNSACLICIAIFYGRLFWVVRETSSSTPVVVKDMEMAVRFFLMVLTDFLCWAPIIVLKLLALKGYRVPDSLLAWTTMVIMPLNSAVNPMLYTFSTGNIRIKILQYICISNSTEARRHRLIQESIEARLMTPEATDDSKINSSQDWRQKHSANSFDQSDSISVVGLKPLGVVPDNGSEGALGFY